VARPVVVAIDLGTSGCRAAAFDETGACAAEAQVTYPTRSPQPGWVEQDPSEWWQAVVTAFRQMLQGLGDPQRIAGISLTAQMAGLVLVGRDGRPLAPALPWMDVRAVAEAGLVEETFGGWQLYERTGCPPRPHYSLPKLLWFKRGAGGSRSAGSPGPGPGASAAGNPWENVGWCFSPKDYVCWRLTAEPLTDPSTAGATQLMNVATRDWDDELLRWLELPRERLPRVVPSVTAVPLRPEAAAELGLAGPPASLSVIVGAGDGVCANLGAGAAAVGMATCNVGTSAAVRVVTAGPAPDPAMRTALYPSADQLWVSNLATNNAGAVLAWFAEAFYDDRSAVERLLGEAAAVAPGADGLLFLPYVFGERSPAFMPPGLARFVGVSAGHRRAHFARAVVEGTAFVVRSLLEVLQQTVPLAALTVTGRVSTAALYRQILADVTGLAVRGTAETGRETGLGAAVLGWVALGRWSSLVDAVQHMVRLTEPMPPVPEHQAAYEQCYRAFREGRETLLAGLRPGEDGSGREPRFQGAGGAKS